MLLGLYLFEQKLINAEQFVEVLRVQQAGPMPLGQLALEREVLSVHQVFEILGVQSEFVHEKFGEIAVSLGFLTTEEVASLLLTQADSRQPFDVLAVELGYLTVDEAETAQIAFRRSLSSKGISHQSVTQRSEIGTAVAAHV